MTRQWLRVCNLSVGNGSEAMDLSNLRIRFTVNRADRNAPGRAQIIVNNLAASTVKKIQKEYDKVVLQVGYEGSVEKIFQGEIVQKRYGRESPTDTYLAILAKDSQQAFSFAFMSKTLAAGHTMKEQVDECLKALKPYGVTAGQIDDLGTAKMPRGRSMFGMVREQLRSIAASTNTSWSIQDGKLNIIKNNSTLNGDTIVMNSSTGMVGMPVQTMGGIEVRCLLNPKIKVGCRIKIDETSIQQQEQTLNYGSMANNSKIPEIDVDGVYKVLDFVHSGDTRAVEWYTDIVCLAVSGKVVPESLTARGIAVPQ